MCGIAGWLGQQSNPEPYAMRMAKSLEHRGPDGQGIKVWREATLIHTRLSILDLSPSGAQPMSNEDSTIWTIVNGEIYNHQEIRQDLTRKGHHFHGHADSEILPHLYEEEGLDCVKKLRGMFALAIYDTKRQTLLLARDQFGIKPLYYAPRGDQLAFASEINALLELPQIDNRPDPQAIYDYAALFYFPAPETFYRGIRALDAGEMLVAKLAHQKIQWNVHSYHQWSINPDPHLSVEDAVEQADVLLNRAVSRQLESDVPLGTLLSGGIDSSLVSAAAARATNGNLRTFNVRFPERAFDETWAAVATANHIGSQHQTLEMDDGGGSWEEVQSLLLHAGQPFCDTAIFPLHSMCREMKRMVTVVLSGDGGDEGFGGYDFYWWLEAILRWQQVPGWGQQGILLGLDFFHRRGLMHERRAIHARELAGQDNTGIVQYLYSRMRQEEHEHLCQGEDLLPIRRLFEPQWDYDLGKSPSRLMQLSPQMTEANIRLRLANSYLMKVDIASMKESLEVRVPMLDEDLMAFGLSLPHRLKIKGRTCKRILRAVSEKWLPIEVARKPKKGFVLPIDTWVDAEFKAHLRESLLGPSSRLPEFFHPSAYRPLIEAFCTGTSYPGLTRETLWQRAIMLLSVHLHLAYAGKS